MNRIYSNIIYIALTIHSQVKRPSTVHQLKTTLCKLILCCLCFCSCAQTKLLSEERPPNFIIIFTDDQGYGDLGCFGGKHLSTPNIDKMAAEGIKLTSFYVAAPICTPSRAALLTACYPKRISMASNVLLADDSKGLHPDEITIAEVLKTKGYATGMMGKWHLGDQAAFMPTSQGFDEFFGLPYSHDISPFHPNNAKYDFPDLPLLEGKKVIEMNPDANYLTQRITDKSVAFIEKHKAEPFFLYIPHPLPHRPVYASPEYMEQVPEITKTLASTETEGVNHQLRDKIYPQAIKEIDASVGKIVAALVANGLDKNTLVIFTSDNGPARRGLGSTGPLKGRKGDTFEGGMREPAIAWWPDKIPAGSVSDEVLTAMDLLPTFAHLAAAKVPDDRVIDGQNVWPVLSGKQASAALFNRPFYYYKKNRLEAVSSGDWKYHKRGKKTMLYNLKADMGETKNVADKHPEILASLQKYFDDFEKELGKGNSVSEQCRPAGYVDMPKVIGY